MKEIRDIIMAFDQAHKDGKRCALCTVVQVDGSSYRRPGARMLVTDDGEITGAISGGCLEGDALYKALFAISTGENKLVTYNSLGEDDIEFGLHLGCNGIVHILFEPIRPENENNPIHFLKAIAESGQAATLSTIFSIKNPKQPGTRLLYLNGEIKTDLPVQLHDLILKDVMKSFSENISCFKNFQSNGFSYTAFIEYIKPSVSLVIAGAGNDVQPLVEMASMLGWSVTVVDGRFNYAVPQRFPKADHVLYSKAASVIGQVKTHEQTVYLLVTHNYNYDLALLRELLNTEFAYIGMLGPAQKRDRMLSDLKEQGIHLSEEQLSKIYGPVGLDIGAETATEIALSVLAEIKAVLSCRKGSSLKLKKQPIHSRLVGHSTNE